MATFGEWNIMAFSNLDLKSYEGDFINRGAGQHGGFVNWKHKNLSIQARYNFFHHAYVEKSASLNSFSCRSANDGPRHGLTLMLTYFFSHGKTRYHEGKLINNMDTNTGLSDYNTSKK